MGWKPRVPVKLEDFANARIRNQWIQDKNMKAFGLYNPLKEWEHLDVVIDYQGRFDQFFERKEVFKDDDLEVPIVSIEDLIKMKKYANRQRDKIDIEALERIKEIKDEKKD